MKYLFIFFLLSIGKILMAQSTLPPSTTHYVELTWQDVSSSSDPTVGFFMYRTPSGTNTFVKITPTKIIPTTYNDSSMPYGASYDYYVTAVDANGVESAPSNTTTALVPFVPYTPIIGTITTGT